MAGSWYTDIMRLSLSYPWMDVVGEVFTNNQTVCSPRFQHIL